MDPLDETKFSLRSKGAAFSYWHRQHAGCIQVGSSVVNNCVQTYPPTSAYRNVPILCVLIYTDAVTRAATHGDNEVLRLPFMPRTIYSKNVYCLYNRRRESSIDI